MFPAPEDYEAIISSTVTFSSTQTSARVSVTIVDDDVLEDVEQFTLEVVATGGQERVDAGDVTSIYISNDDCEKILFSNTSNVLCVPHTCLILYALLTWLHMCSCTCLSFGLSVCLSVSLSVCLSNRVSVHLSLCLSVTLSVNLSVQWKESGRKGGPLWAQPAGKVDRLFSYREHFSSQGQ